MGSVFFGLFSVGCIISASGLRCWTCENAKSPTDCVEQGESKQCNFLQKVCQTEVRYSVGWGKDPMIRTGCKEPHACGNNNKQNPRLAWLPTQCNAGKFNSVCRCCCTGDHCNNRNLLCRTIEKQEAPLLTTEEIRSSTQPPKDVPTSSTFDVPVPEPICEMFPEAPDSGIVICEGKTIGSSCYFSCRDDYVLVGSAKTTCSQSGKTAKWSHIVPACVYEKRCIKLPHLLINGKMDCHGSGEVGTECSFVCDEGYTLNGASRIECGGRTDIPVWSNEYPTCLLTIPHCPTLGKIRHGNVSCTQEENRVGTKCLFRCSEEGYELLPRGRYETECVLKQGKAFWTRRKPCCSVECPPFTKKDIVIAIDSSRSISSHEWNMMKEFIANVIRNFDVTFEAVQFAVYRFNGKVDTKSQILFGDYANSDELIHAVENLPKEGGGTRIGKALEHARDYVLRHENREAVDDMIWVVTDGKSKDEFLNVAEDLRGEGVEIIALGISRTGEEEFFEHLTEMTGSRELVMEVEDVKKSFTEALVQRVTRKICEVSCDQRD